MGVTAHYFDENLVLKSRALDVLQNKSNKTAKQLAKLVKECLNEWKTFTKVEHIVADGAAVMRSMVVDELKKKYLPCAAHSFHLLVKHVISNLPENDVVAVAVQKCKNLVSLFHRSPKSTRLLQTANASLLEEGERLPRKLIQYVSIIITYPLLFRTLYY